MRLSAKEHHQIVEVIHTTLLAYKYQLFLFGSRTSDSAKGGDIDLLIIVPSSDLDAVRRQKRVLYTELEKKLGERRIDVVIASDKPEEQSELVQVILPSAIKL